MKKRKKQYRFRSKDFEQFGTHCDDIIQKLVPIRTEDEWKDAYYISLITLIFSDLQMIKEINNFKRCQKYPFLSWFYKNPIYNLSYAALIRIDKKFINRYHYYVSGGLMGQEAINAALISTYTTIQKEFE